MPFTIVRNNITNMHTDAIVNTANPHPVIGAGVDSAIHAAAGPKLLKARRQIGDIAAGQAAITPAFDLHANYIIHTVGPIWQGGDSGEAQLLSSCYEHALSLAAEYHCQSISFPLIATGTYGFPKELALQTAISAISSFLLQHEMMVYLVVLDSRSFALSEKLFQAVESYIDETYAREVQKAEYAHSGNKKRERLEAKWRRKAYAKSSAPEDCSECALEDSALPHHEAVFSASVPQPSRKLEDLIKELDQTFSESLLSLIDARNLTDPQVYKKANIDRKLFSKIRTNKDYKPSKTTALALAIALELNLDETKDLIGRAGFALTHSSKFDVIVEYFILQGNYNIFELNEVLFAFEQSLIGA